MRLRILKMKFSASHYIPGHEKCGVPHGHTYFIEDFSIDVSDVGLDKQGISIDFGVIKGYIKENWDHKFIVPEEHYDTWKKVYEQLNIEDNLVPINHTTVEGIIRKIRDDLSIKLKIPKKSISFGLYEGPNQGLEL